ncbi:MAG: hypothetical protein H0Z32_14285 [Bacillaceae bacterium]|nr:hypothetical protein [Bacillaceae bacterium]
MRAIQYIGDHILKLLYDPSVDRFLTPDTYRGELTNPLTQNRYAYVLNNPVNMWDPTGHVPEWVGDDTYFNIIYFDSGESRLEGYFFKRQYFDPSGSSELIKRVENKRSIELFYKQEGDQVYVYDYLYRDYYIDGSSKLFGPFTKKFRKSGTKYWQTTISAQELNEEKQQEILEQYGTGPDTGPTLPEYSYDQSTNSQTRAMDIDITTTSFFVADQMVSSGHPSNKPVSPFINGPTCGTFSVYDMKGPAINPKSCYEFTFSELKRDLSRTGRDLGTFSNYYAKGIVKGTVELVKIPYTIYQNYDQLKELTYEDIAVGLQEYAKEFVPKENESYEEFNKRLAENLGELTGPGFAIKKIIDKAPAIKKDYITDPPKVENPKELLKVDLQFFGKGSSKTVDDLIKNATPGRATKGRTSQYDLSGGFDKAVKDFESLQPNITKNTPDLKVGKLPDGRTVIVRKKSSDGRPTIEIQDGKKKIKFRY